MLALGNASIARLFVEADWEWGLWPLTAFRGTRYGFTKLIPRSFHIPRDQRRIFTFIRDSSANVTIVRGDARLSLERELKEKTPQSFDVLVLDAFSSDAIPVHLVTQEAVEVYLQHLRGPDSILAFHISNRSLDLRPVIAAIAARNHLSLVMLGNPNSSDFGESSDWVLLSRNSSALNLAVFQGHFQPMPPADPAFLWTDDYNNLFHILKRQ